MLLNIQEMGSKHGCNDGMDGMDDKDFLDRG